MSTDEQIEKEIQDKGLTAPRVTPADLEAEILSEHYFTAYQGALGAAHDAVDSNSTNHDVYNSKAEVPAILDKLKLLTFSVLVLRNGFTVTGKSACASPENFDAELGRKIARLDALNQLWSLLGFRLRDKLTAQAAAAARGPRYRCASTGTYVTEEYAKAHPDTTVRES